ncbi:hypothetical protein M758_12G063800 [Ceratodon purpureus]|nr:hypothetical protein M758_12G063800 [Ceratodon purpureus]
MDSHSPMRMMMLLMRGVVCAWAKILGVVRRSGRECAIPCGGCVWGVVAMAVLGREALRSSATLASECPL